MKRDILSDYLAQIARIRATRAGTGEISYGRNSTPTTAPARPPTGRWTN